MKLPSLRTFHLKSKRVLVRVDVDIPLENGQVADDTRLRECLPTIEYLLKQGAKVILLGHLGRPEGKINPEFSLKPVAEKLGELLCCRFKESNLGGFGGYEGFEGDGEIFILENLRFYPGEESNDPQFAKSLAGLGDFYVNEAFASSHREHASIVGVPKLLPHAAGYHFQKEVENLSKVIENPRKPLVVIIGGAKVETKLSIIKGLFDKADIFLLGGVVANTFMAADKIHPKKVGRSKIDENFLNEAKTILSLQQGKRTVFPNFGEIWRIKLPPDVIIADEEGNGLETVYISGKEGEAFGQNKMILDIGPETAKLYEKIINLAGTVIWNGPMGKVEGKEGQEGTRRIGEAIANSTAFKVVGGGDTVAALKKFGLLAKMDYVSTGGGAMLEFLAKGTLPGIDALKLTNNVGV